MPRETAASRRLQSVRFLIDAAGATDLAYLLVPTDPLTLSATTLRPLLAQGASDAAPSALFWSVVLLVFVVVAMGVLVWIRKRMSPNEDFHGEGFTLSDLRRLHKAGQLTDEEFERAKAQMVAGLQKKTDQQAGPTPAAHEFKAESKDR